MICLIDTHIFIWWTARDPKLKPEIQQIISDPAHQVYVGASSIWEITTKRRLGKLAFTGSPIQQAINSGFQNLSILPEDAELAGEMRWNRKDPFGRFLVAQAVRLSATLVTADKAIRAYGTIPILWAG
jgi:PIN domain nuclease of toxin-antitoxin system